MKTMKLMPVSSYKPAIQNAYNRIKALGLLAQAREIAKAAADYDDTILQVYDLLPESDRSVLNHYDEKDCWLLASLLIDSNILG